MHFYALLCTSLHFFALPCTPNWECILPMHSQLGVHNFFHFYALPEPIFKNPFLVLFLVLGVHDFALFYALPDFQNFFYWSFWFWECMIFLIFMHSQISKTFSTGLFGSGSA